MKASHRIIMSFGLATLVIGAAAIAVADDPPPVNSGRESTLRGRVVELRSYITGHYKTEDKARATKRAIRTGSPAGLETKGGIVILGKSQHVTRTALSELAFEQAEITGVLYERDGVRFLDMTGAKRIRTGNGGDAEQANKDAHDEE
ncbi:MAG: hypothetical protein ACYTHJ_02465 [Planctomycetota bacterium]|jgi:hypothetical protein